MTEVRDALATALHMAEDPHLRDVSLAQTRKADAILSDPAFRSALTDAIAEALHGDAHGVVRAGDGYPCLVCYHDDGYRARGAAIVARMLDPQP